MAYLVLLALGALDSAGYSIIAPVVPAIETETGAGAAVIGALVASFAVGQMLGYPLAGRGVERRHAVVVLGASLALVVAGDLGFVLGEDLAVYFPARVLQGIGAGGLWIGVAFAVIERFPGQEYRRLTGVLAAYGAGAIAGPAIGGVGGIRGPFALHLALVVVLALALLAVPAPRAQVRFSSDRRALRTPGFWLASAGILLVSLTLGSFDGPLPLHFADRLDQREIAALYVVAALVGAASSALAGRLPPGPTLVGAAVVMPAAVALGGLTSSVPLWIAVAVLAGVGIGSGESGALGVLLDAVGVDRIVVAMVVWSQVWAIGYLAGPAAGGAVAEALGFGALGLVPAAAAFVVVAALARARPPLPA